MWLAEAGVELKTRETQPEPSLMSGGS